MALNLPKTRLQNGAKPHYYGTGRPKTCCICADTKTPNYFRAPRGIRLCQHFTDICKNCVEQLVDGKTENRDLENASLECPYPECEFVVEFRHVKQMVSPEVFNSLDRALLLNHLTTSEHIIACLNPHCDNHFSVEGWSEECESHKMDCPECGSSQCSECNRPWASCDCAKKASEEAATIKAMRKMGVKQCPNPKCGVRIVKNQGCDHMTCRQCKHQFCWLCLQRWGGQHGEPCRPNARQNVLADPGSFFTGPDDALFDLIAQQTGDR